MNPKILQRGLSSEEAHKRQALFGKNKITTQESLSFLKILLSQFLTAITAVLFIAAILSLLTGNIPDSVIIFVTILLNGLLGFTQEYQAEKALQKLKSFVVPICKVLRDGKLVELFIEDIVPGDVVILNEGDSLPADGQISEATHLEIDESMLTGESLPVEKELHGEAFCATLVIRGKGELEVTQIGDKTRIGKIAQTLASIKSEQTPLQKQTTQFTKTISLITVVLCGILFGIGIFQGHSLIPLILLVVSVGVAAMPESLPAVITIALAVGTSRMAHKKAIVRKLSAVETVGMSQVILTDKTGTLTQNKMQVKDFFVTKESLLSHMVQACLLGNTATITKKDGVVTTIGDKTDAAVLLWASDQKQNNSWEKAKILDEYIFDSVAKTITTVVEKNRKREVFLRGAPELILENSTLDEKEKAEIQNRITSFASSGFRIIGCGYKEEKHKIYTRKHVEHNIIFLGFLVLYDPPREEVKDAVQAARQAGIHVAMVTGDNPYTAVSIGLEVGIADEGEQAITGMELARLSDEEVKKILMTSHIFARMSPEDKLRLTKLCKELDLVVGVTGDGVNDTLALKAADVGIAMGEKGSDVAREASDIVLTNDSFAVIVTAIAEGRSIYANIVKAIVYLLTGNLSELVLIFGAFLVGLPYALLPTQVLWINLITDGLPAIALANDTTQRHVMTEKPRGKMLPILTRNRLLFIAFAGVGLGVGFLMLFSMLLSSHVGEITSRTIVFNVLIMSHMGLAFIVRRKAIFTLNWFLIGTVSLTFCLQALITFNPFFQELFHLLP